MDEGLQQRSKLWWSENPMSYDWHKTATAGQNTIDFYREIDQRFFSSSPFYRGKQPFEGLIPFHQLRGRRVLEVGCGLGSHAQLLAEAGCKFTAIDLTPRAVGLTEKRLQLHGLEADVRQMDAEHMKFADEEFDFVWSWGVIHHSANPENIIREVHRVLKPSGQFRVMVYYRQSLEAWVSVIRGTLSGKLFRGMSLEDIRNCYTDGYIARFYTRSEFSEILRGCGFRTIQMRILGQKSELLPLPGKGLSGRLKSTLLRGIPNRAAELVLSSAGMFLFATVTKDPS
jgi:2-polyprenyl-3-methyl-5-hydroxy-6-metoxy-1,4-benzoquinol methylase